MHRKIFNRVLFAFAFTVLMVHLCKKAEKESNPPPPPSQGTLKVDLEPRSVKELSKSEEKKPVSENSDKEKSEVSNRIAKCIEERSKEIELACPNGECVYENLQKYDSWAKHWWEDGWRGNNTPTPNQRTKLGRLNYALAQAGLLSGADKKIPKDNDEAIASLKQLSREEPRNSFPILYLAVIYDRLGDKEKSKEYIKIASQKGMRFESYFDDFNRELTLTNRNNINEAIMAIGVKSVVDIADYVTLQRLLVQYPEHGASLGEQMMMDGHKLKKPDEIYWSPIEYAVGHHVYKKSGGKKKYPKFNELFQKSYYYTNSFTGGEPRGCDEEIQSLLTYLNSLE